MVQNAAVCQRLTREQTRSVLMTGRFSICETDSNAGQFRAAEIGALLLRHGKDEQC
jgi:hypothetical protein